VRQFLLGALPWTLAIGAGVALALGFAQLGGTATLPTFIAKASVETSAARTGTWFEGDRPRPETREFLAILRRADEHGLNSADYRPDAIEHALVQADSSDRTVASTLLSEALATYARDLRIPRSLEDVVYIDPELIPAEYAAADLLSRGSLAETLRTLHAFSPAYENLRAGLLQYRATWGALLEVPIPDGPSLAKGATGERVMLLRQRLGLPVDGPGAQRFDAALGERVSQFRRDHGLAPQPVADRATIAALNRGAGHYERIIIANLDRLRALPGGDSRYVLVDTAAAELRLIEDGEEVDTMRAVVGRRGMETPLLAGFIRYAVVNPYWNVPPDLVRNSVAPAVLREGVGALARRNFVLSPDWQTDTRVDPDAVNWPAIATGRESVWVRQLPGGTNMMGNVKFMLPNDLGIYLHDTPNKSLFRREDRRLSSGCVRLEDADRLARWLFRDERVLQSSRTPDHRVDLADPVPVFITYLTAVFEDGRIRFRPDVEQRDEAVLARFGSPARTARLSQP
jgi:L,D-transpeptidase YcbB